MDEAAGNGRGNTQRLEAFSDAVFAFALTFLVVSLEVPSTFTELLRTISGFVAFAFCFAIVTLIWHEHNRYFRRFGSEDTQVHLLNSALLFVILFYVYPLKFVSTLVVGIFGLGTLSNSAITQNQVPKLLAIYSVGFVAVFALLALLHRRSNALRHKLRLNELERFDILAGMQSHSISAGIGVLSILLAAVLRPEDAQWAGWIYFLMGPLHAVHGAATGRRRKRLLPPKNTISESVK